MKSGSLNSTKGEKIQARHTDLNHSESQYSEPPGQIFHLLCILQVDLDGLSASWN